MVSQKWGALLSVVALSSTAFAACTGDLYDAIIVGMKSYRISLLWC
jgi:hypothetical protein